MGAAWEGLSICGLREGMGKGTREPAGWPFWPGSAKTTSGLAGSRLILHLYAYLRSLCSVFLPPGISVQTEEGREEV